MQFRIGGRTDAGWITQADILARGGEIEVELLIEVVGVTFEVERAASGAGSQRLYERAIASKRSEPLSSLRPLGSPA